MAGSATTSTTNTTTSNTPFAAESRWDIASGSALGLGSIIGGFMADHAYYKAQKANAKALKQQAGIYGSMADAQLRAAGMYSSQAAAIANAAKTTAKFGPLYAKYAEANARYGQANARRLRMAAANLDDFEQIALHKATVEARQRVGAGRAQFAANGVMVDSGAAALWEQDEAADAALERLDIMQQFEDQSWEYRTQANKALAQGYEAAAGMAANAANVAAEAAGQAGSAAGQAGAAMGAAGDAYAYRLQQSAALAEASKKAKKRYGGIGAVVGGVAGAVIGTFCGGNTAAGFMIGSSLGGAVGSAA